VRVLGEMKRVLKPGGRFLIDFLNPAYLKQHLIPVSERVDEPTGYRIREARTFEGDFVVKRITVSSPADETGSASRHYEERVRLIELAQFEEMLQEAALSLDLVYGDYEGNAYETMTSKRLILLGRRDV
jgi:ubiquinone/menaquinone biosynthesis C-methylase UbiE